MVCQMEETHERILPNLNQRSGRLPEGLGGVGEWAVNSFQPEVVKNLPNQQVKADDMGIARSNHNPTKISLYVFCQPFPLDIVKSLGTFPQYQTAFNLATLKLWLKTDELKGENRDGISDKASSKI